MALTNIELYEALKNDISEEAARMIAEVVPPSSDVAVNVEPVPTAVNIILAPGTTEPL